MKKIILLTVSVFFVTLMFAQGIYTATVIEKADKITQQMKSDLNLTPAQQSQVQAINLEVVKRLDEALLNSGDKVLLKSKVQAINSYRNSELKKTLTPQQFAYMTANTNGRNCR
jgi:hypothetical protein